MPPPDEPRGADSVPVPVPLGEAPLGDEPLGAEPLGEVS
jgi:hypothetical protein